MKVLYLLRYFPTLTETFVYREIDALAEHGVQVTIASLGRRADGGLQQELPQAPVWQVPRHSLRGLLSRSSLFRSSISQSSPGQAWLRSVREDRDAARLPWLASRAAGMDRIHAHFAGGAAEWAHALSLDLGLPYSVTVHAVDLFRPRPTLDTVLGGAQAVLTVASHHQQLLADRGHASRLVRCGPRLEDWRLPPPSDGPLRALAVGRDVPKKGLDLLVEAWRRLDQPQARLTIVSDLPDPGLPGIEVPGLLPPARVRQLMAGCNLVVLPCRRAPDGDMDGVPVVLMEGLAAGRAVISTRVSGVPELVDDRVGWLLPADDLPALVDALRQANDRPGQRQERGSRGPERLESRGFTARAQALGVLAAWRSEGGP